MKKSLITLMLVMTSLTAFNAHAIPPVPPSSLELANENIVCKDAESISEEEMEYIMNHPESVLTVLTVENEIKEVCIELGLDQKK